MGLTTIGVALKQLWLEPQRACAVLYAGVPEHTAPLERLRFAVESIRLPLG